MKSKGTLHSISKYGLLYPSSVSAFDTENARTENMFWIYWTLLMDQKQGSELAVRLAGLSAVKLSAAVGVRAQLQTLVESVLSYKHYNTM